tara:strand:- start:211 stop:546 length:336 start_codon:yes stop_codon:yes gene_type:complete
MAETFKSVVSNGVGTSSTTLYTCPANTTTIILGLLFCNVRSPLGDIQVSSTLTKSGGTSAKLVENVKIFSGASLSLVGENNKVVLEAGDSIAVLSDVASSLDMVLSILEIS